MKIKRWLFSIATVYFFATSGLAAAEEIILRWHANVESDLQGYNVYYGNQSKAYYPPIPVGKINEYTVPNLDPGQTYFFAITAVDSAGNESDYSIEYVITIPEPGSVIDDSPIVNPIDDIILSAIAYKNKSGKFAHLRWSEASSDYIDVYRNGSLIPDAWGIPNDGEYVHGPFKSGKPATYQVCLEDSTTCSNEITLSW
jgi:hypothetical protein